MENQDSSSPNPHNYNTNYNNYVNHNNNCSNNVNSISSSQHPSPTTPAPQFTASFWNSDDSSSPSMFKGLYHRRAYSDESFQITGSDGDGDGIYTPEKMGAEEDELVSVFLNEDNAGGGDAGELMDQDAGSGGGKTKKKSSRGIRRPNLPAELADMWDEDPKRVKRILANRQSAARSKERKVRYMLELERRIQALQFDSWNLSAQVSIYERETRGLSTENVELKLRLQAMEEQAHLHDAINEALRNEVESLKIANAELRTPTSTYPFGDRQGSLASPSTQTSQLSLHFSQLTSPSTLQSPSHSTQPLTSPSTVQLPLHYSPLTSPSTVLTSPSTVNTIYFSPLTSLSLLQTVPLTQQASPSRPSVYAVAPLPPLHKSRSSIISRRLRQANLVARNEKNDSSPGESNKGPDVENGEHGPVSGSRSGSATP